MRFPDHGDLYFLLVKAEWHFYATSVHYAKYHYHFYGNIIMFFSALTLFFIPGELDSYKADGRLDSIINPLHLRKPPQSPLTDRLPGPQRSAPSCLRRNLLLSHTDWGCMEEETHRGINQLLPPCWFWRKDVCYACCTRSAERFA